MRSNESKLEVEASLVKNNNCGEFAWKDMSFGEKVMTGVLYSNLVVAPIINIAIYSTIAGTVLYYALK